MDHRPVIHITGKVIVPIPWEAEKVPVGLLHHKAVGHVFDVGDDGYLFFPQPHEYT